MSDRDEKLEKIKKYYDEEYYSGSADLPDNISSLPWHSRMVAARLGDLSGKSVLDIGCGRGEWLAFLKNGNCHVSGIDLSSKAIETCKRRMPAGQFVTGPAETLPFGDAAFDLVTCLGSLEHFLDKAAALREMVRVAKPEASFLLLVPNSGFLTRRVGLYHGTNQAHIKEDVLSLERWAELFSQAGLKINHRWKDLHMLNPSWINLGSTLTARVARTMQALALMVWPIRWQYQVYFYCERA